MKKSIQIIATAFAILLGNVGFSQNDTIYFIKDGVVVNKQSILSTDIDSAVFYNPFHLATLTTTTVSSITETTAVSGGNITNNGGATVTSRGICWGTSSNPTPADNSSVNGSGAGGFASNLSGLTGGTTYYVRAYAINSVGTSYGNEVSFTTTSSSGVVYGDGVTDANGNTYQSVIIGTQEWMSENLRTTKYSDGTSIPNVTVDSQWANLSTEAWSYYNNDNKYDTIYGKLYNWYAVETGKLCPTGWHVPTDLEWTVLTDYLIADGHSGAEGKALKATSGWKDRTDGTSGNGTDDYGWKGLPGGYNYPSGSFSQIGEYGSWWSFSENNTTYSWFRYLGHIDNQVVRHYANKKDGFSVRCLRDNESTQTTSQVRLDNGEAPLDIYQSGIPIDSIIGKTYQGGLIAYLDTLDGTGLIAAITDQSDGVAWGCLGTLISGADGTAIGTGSQNTADILAGWGCSETNIAAYLCDTLTLGGYNDWFLPSKDELNKLVENIGQGNALGLGNVGGFANGHYWSSTENDYYDAWIQDFYDGTQNNGNKANNYYDVRAVRAF